MTILNPILDVLRPDDIVGQMQPFRETTAPKSGTQPNHALTWLLHENRKQTAPRFSSNKHRHISALHEIVSYCITLWNMLLLCCQDHQQFPGVLIHFICWHTTKFCDIDLGRKQTQILKLGKRRNSPYQSMSEATMVKLLIWTSRHIMIIKRTQWFQTRRMLKPRTYANVHVGYAQSMTWKDKGWKDLLSRPSGGTLVPITPDSFRLGWCLLFTFKGIERSHE